MKLRFWYTFVASSQLLNVLLSSKVTQTTPNESISGRAYRQRQRKEKYIDLLFKVFRGEDNHCRNAYYEDLRQAEEYIRKHNEHRPEV